MVLRLFELQQAPLEPSPPGSEAEAEDLEETASQQVKVEEEVQSKESMEESKTSESVDDPNQQEMENLFSENGRLSGASMLMFQEMRFDICLFTYSSLSCFSWLVGPACGLFWRVALFGSVKSVAKGEVASLLEGSKYNTSHPAIQQPWDCVFVLAKPQMRDTDSCSR